VLYTATWGEVDSDRNQSCYEGSRFPWLYLFGCANKLVIKEQ